MDYELGFFIHGVFVSATQYQRKDGKFRVRAFLSVGNQVYAVSSSNVDYFSGYTMGQEIWVPVRVNLFNGELYYSLSVS